MVVESESLLNDGVAAVGFAVLSAIAAGASPGAGNVIPAFLWTLGGGIVIGLAVSAAILLIVGRTDDPLVEITLTTIAAYGSFLIAEHFRASGIISALTAGLLIGSAGTRFLSRGGRDRVGRDPALCSRESNRATHRSSRPKRRVRGGALRDSRCAGQHAGDMDPRVHLGSRGSDGPQMDPAIHSRDSARLPTVRGDRFLAPGTGRRRHGGRSCT